ncbi:MAG: sterol desaturase family protein [Bdellovibrionaceae bacterium]|jgi:sterol desaturase/sphingolipid hydroxylase (fatty acid hydroxylase superfamily)|nr:sterol desaturase family protein [Pseudobdellovibrionaceae bacterium]
MESVILKYEAQIRLAAFIGIFAIMAITEIFKPYRKLTQSKLKRWRTNLTLVVTNTVLAKFILPVTAVFVAQQCQANDIGILNYLNIGGSLNILLTVIALDFFIWLQHVVVHAVPMFWRLHRVHHTDLDYDVTTGARFHPIEILMSMMVKIGVISFLGPSAEGVILFEVILNGSAMFNHSNIQFPKWVDKWLRYILVTPNMHRIHHCVGENETNSNFGFCLAWWDLIFDTHMWNAKQPDDKFVIGLDTIRDPKDCVNYWGLFKTPFVGKVTAYSLNRRKF